MTKKTNWSIDNVIKTTREWNVSKCQIATCDRVNEQIGPYCCAPLQMDKMLICVKEDNVFHSLLALIWSMSALLIKNRASRCGIEVMFSILNLLRVVNVVAEWKEKRRCRWISNE